MSRSEGEDSTTGSRTSGRDLGKVGTAPSSGVALHSITVTPGGTETGVLTSFFTAAGAAAGAAGASAAGAAVAIAFSSCGTDTGR